MTKEIWKVLKRSPNYSISNMGCVKKGEKFLHLVTMPNGLLYVNIGRKKKNHRRTIFKTIYVHKLVAETFIGPRPNKKSRVIHKNSIKNDNRAINLMYGSGKDVYELYTKNNGKKKTSLLTCEDVKQIKERLCLCEKPQDIAEKFHVNACTIKSIRAGRIWSDIPWPSIKKNFYYTKRYGNLLFVRKHLRQIKTLLDNNVRAVTIAKKFNLCESCISRIVNGKSYKENK